MRIDVVGKHMEVTAAIRSYAEQKATKLLKHFDGVQLITFRVSQDPRGKGFGCEVVADVQGHDDFIGNGHHEDLYAAIDETVDKVVRQLTTHKEKLKHGKH